MEGQGKGQHCHQSDSVCFFCVRNTEFRLFWSLEQNGKEFRRNFSLQNPGIPTELQSVPSSSVFRGIFLKGKLTTLDKRCNNLYLVKRIKDTITAYDNRD